MREAVVLRPTLITVSYSALQFLTVHYSFLQCTTVSYSFLQCTTVSYSALQFLTVHYSFLQCTTVSYSALQFLTVQYNFLQCNTVSYSAIQFLTVRYSLKTLNKKHPVISYIKNLRKLLTTHTLLRWLEHSQFIPACIPVYQKKFPKERRFFSHFTLQQKVAFLYAR